MRWIAFLGALLMAACSQSQPVRTDSMPAARGSLSPAAPVNLTYQVEQGAAGQPQRIDIAINTRLTSGALLVEVAKQEGAAAMGEITQRIDLAHAAHPIAMQMQATLLGAGEHYLVLLLTIDTEMGPMSRSFRIDLAPADSGATQ